MIRQNLFSDAWDGDNEEDRTRHRIFWRPDDARMGATLYELAPDAPEMRMHMHFGAEEMFFVLSGRPVFRNQHGEEELAPGDFVFCPEGRAGLHAIQQPQRRTRSDPRDQCRELPGRCRLPRTRICMGGDSRSRSRATRERRRPRHHRSLRDPDRVDRPAACRPSRDTTKRLRRGSHAPVEWRPVAELDSEVRELLDRWAASPATPVSELTAEAVREDDLAVLDLQRGPGELYSVEDVEAPAPAGASSSTCSGTATATDRADFGYSLEEHTHTVAQLVDDARAALHRATARQPRREQRFRPPRLQSARVALAGRSPRLAPRMRASGGRRGRVRRTSRPRSSAPRRSR